MHRFISNKAVLCGPNIVSIQKLTEISGSACKPDIVVCRWQLLTTKCLLEQLAFFPMDN